MSKANKDQTDQEFAYTYALKRMMHDLAPVSVHLTTAKSAGMQGLSGGALIVIENELALLKSAIANALKTV
jgi:hypothetical protein